MRIEVAGGEPFFTRPPGPLRTATIVVSAIAYGLLAGLLAGATQRPFLSILAVVLFLGVIYGLLVIAWRLPATRRGFVALIALYAAGAAGLLWRYAMVLREGGPMGPVHHPVAGFGSIIALCLLFNIAHMVRRLRRVPKAAP